MAQRRSSETLSHDTFEQAPIGISYMDREGRVLRANSAFCKLLGFDTSEIESKLIAEVTHDADAAHNAAEIERLWHGHIEVIDVEKRYVRADGRALWVRATTALIREDGGAPTCSVEFLRDISARKDLSAALSQNQRLLQAVIADLPVAIRACDGQGRVFLHNPAAAQIFALRAPEDSAGSGDRLAVEVFLPDGKTPVPIEERPLGRALRGENVTNMELLIGQPGDAVRTTLNSARRLTGQDGESLGAVALTQDITDKKKLERELASAQKLESIGQLAAGIAHEINTPTQFIGDNIRFLQESGGRCLRVIDRVLELGNAQNAAMISAKGLEGLFAAVDMNYLREEVPKAILLSLDGVERISKIVGAMKEFSHPATDKAPHDLNRAILSTITVATNEWKYLADVVTDLAPDLPFVPVMPGAFNQVVLNILVNAAHAIGAGNAETAVPKGRDYGINPPASGLGAEDRDQRQRLRHAARNSRANFRSIFYDQRRGQGNRRRFGDRTRCDREKHHGTITVESAPGLGTTFVLRLPLEASDAAAA